MYLKSIELQGFKSFADPVIFQFDEGISAIVGPNGSGKSNIVDGIRWVLGEQSAKSLRGGKMEDVIFSGSESRKQVGLARVTLTLDNAKRAIPFDYDEIEVQRTLHRSGESEYQLNRKNCRLKDIHELFMDTGIGRDGFSVIGQGKIDEILVQQAHERRTLIEEAAGISKYKYRKHEAQRKLESTRDDMERLDDLLYELEDRVEPLAKQAEKVKQYRLWKAEEDELRLAYLVDGYHKTQISLDRIGEELEKSKVLIQEQYQEEKEIEINRETITRQYQEEEGLLEALNGEFILCGRQQESLKGEKAVLEERERYLTKEIEENKRHLRELSAEREDQEKLCASLKINQDDNRSLLDKYRVEHARITEDYQTTYAELQANKEKLEELKEKQFSLFQESASLNNEITRLQQERSGQQVRQERMMKRLDDLSQEKEKLLERQRLDEEKGQDEEKKLVLLYQNKENLEQARQEQTQALYHKQTSLTALKEKIQQYASRYHVLQDLENSGEGYYQGVQAVLKGSKKGLFSIEGSVAQLLDIPEAYIIALEQTLASAAQNIVVDTDQDAEEIITWLKKERRGRVTFMPLNTVKGGRSNLTLNEDGVIGLALDLVDFDPKYQVVMEQLLGRVWIVEDIAKARKIARKHQFKVRLVTLEGDVLAPGGSMSGGRLNKSSQLLRRKNELSLLEETMASLNRDFERDKDAYQALLDQENAMTDKMEKLKEEIHQKELFLSEHKALLAQLDLEVGRLNRHISEEGQDDTYLKLDLTRANDALFELQMKKDKLIQEIDMIEASIVESDVRRKYLEELESRQRLAMQDMRIKEAQEQEKENYALREWTLAKDKLEKISSEIVDRESSISDHEKEFAQLKDDRENLLGRISDNEEDYNRLFQELDHKKKNLLEIKEEVAKVEKHMESLKTTLRENETIYGQQQQDHDRHKLRLERYSEDLSSNLGLSYGEAKDQANKELDLSGAKERLQNLKFKRMALGDLNFTAIEEYDAVQERVAFLSQQLDDLRHAKEKLETVIREMEKTMSERFKETYDEVNGHFEEIFERMFQGGNAHLSLSMPENLLETGIEIIAQPPGKKASVLTLLSGGERAMTAIALLFALQEVRPSPFVILDEIEAALDEANIDRFASFLKVYAAKTQFIIISHRRGTIESASVLYGVTMEKNGVSKQVSVRLNEDEEDF